MEDNNVEKVRLLLIENIYIYVLKKNWLEKMVPW